MAYPTPAQLQNFSLSGSGISIGDTSMTLSSFQTIDGVDLVIADFGGSGYMTLEPGSRDREEQISFTGITQNANGTATLTGIKTVLFLTPFTETSGIAKSHPGGVVAVVTNTSGFYNAIKVYIDTALSAGAVPATTLVNGIGHVSVAPTDAANPIFVGTNDPRVPTADPTTLFAPKAFYPIGSIYMATVSTDPATLLGFGTWVAYGVGRVLIGAGTGTVIATFSSRSSNVITVTGLTNAANNEFQTGQAVLYLAPSGAMTGLTDNTTYYVVKVSNTTFSLASSLANAQNGTVISLSSDGTGTQTFTKTFTARTAGDTGGEENHAMSLTEILSHNHANYWDGNRSAGGADAGGMVTGGLSSGGGVVTSVNSAAGGNAAMNIMQPFITCYIWNRTA